MTGMKREIAYQEPPRTRKELRELHERVVKKVKAMSPQECFQTIVRAGIYTQQGKLAKEYRG